MGFGAVDRAGDTVIEARKLSKKFDKPLFQNLNLSIDRGQCVGVLGPNGAGKSTLIKTLIGIVPPDSGEVKLGHKVTVGYHDQGLESLPDNTTVLRAVWPDDEPDWEQGDVRDLLAKFGLPGDLALAHVKQLSGGERSKAALARLAATSANLLIMDEPTNHLDIWSCDSLERSIVEFEGTILVVSHDRYFLNQVADRIIEVKDGRARAIDGDYEDYQRVILREAEAEARKATPTATASPSTSSSRSDKPEKRKRKFPFRKTPEIEREIAKVEAEIAQLEDTLGQPATWREPFKAIATQDRHKILSEQLPKLYEAWEEAVELNS